MNIQIPPLLQEYMQFFDQNPLLAVLLGLLVVVIAVALMRVALRMFLFFLLLLVLLLLASYFFVGEEPTNDALRRSAQDAGQKVEQVLEKGKQAIEKRLPVEDNR